MAANYCFIAERRKRKPRDCQLGNQKTYRSVIHCEENEENRRTRSYFFLMLSFLSRWWIVSHLCFYMHQPSDSHELLRNASAVALRCLRTRCRIIMDKPKKEKKSCPT